MEQFETMETSRGRKEYEAKIKNLEGIFSKLQKLSDKLDLSGYINKFNDIKEYVKNNLNLSTKMISENMQMDYEDYALKPYSDKLDNLLKDIEDEIIPFYELHLLTTKINMQISEITCDNILEIINNTKTLINSINALNTHDIKGKNKLIEEAYKTVYSTIMYEEIFDKSDVLTYINYLNIPVNRENLGRLLSNDLKNLSEKDLIEEDLRTLKTEGLGYDYLNTDIIRKISRKTVGETNSEYQERKKQAIKGITYKVKNFEEEKDKLKTNLNNNNAIIRSLRIKKSLLISKVLSIVLIPVITFSVGKFFGKGLSNKITEYKTITRTVDLNTKKIIGEPIEIFDDKETTYVATIMECSPWRKNTTGTGYIRNITAFEYNISEDVEDDYHLTLEDINKENQKEKYTYVEHKETLDNEDSTTDYSILITETFQDKNQNRKSTKFILPFSIIGIGIGLFIDVTLTLIGVFGIEKTKRKFEKLNDEIKENQLDNQIIKEKLQEMKKEAEKLQDEFNEVVKHYGSIGDQLIIPEIDSTWIPQIKKLKK